VCTESAIRLKGERTAREGRARGEWHGGVRLCGQRTATEPVVNRRPAATGRHYSMDNGRGASPRSDPEKAPVTTPSTAHRRLISPARSKPCVTTHTTALPVRAGPCAGPYASVQSKRGERGSNRDPASPCWDDRRAARGRFGMSRRLDLASVALGQSTYLPAGRGRSLWIADGDIPPRCHGDIPTPSAVGFAPPERLWRGRGDHGGVRGHAERGRYYGGTSGKRRVPGRGSRGAITGASWRE